MWTRTSRCRVVDRRSSSATSRRADGRTSTPSPAAHNTRRHELDKAHNSCFQEAPTPERESTSVIFWHCSLNLATAGSRSFLYPSSHRPRHNTRDALVPTKNDTIIPPDSQSQRLRVRAVATRAALVLGAYVKPLGLLGVVQAFHQSIYTMREGGRGRTHPLHRPLVRVELERPHGATCVLLVPLLWCSRAAWQLREEHKRAEHTRGSPCHFHRQSGAKLALVPLSD